VSTWQGWVYVALVIDVFSRRIVGWRMGSSDGGWLALSVGLDCATDTRLLSVCLRKTSPHELNAI
jgi:hypothetical protein